jgi:hypothetical protein
MQRATAQAKLFHAHFPASVTIRPQPVHVGACAGCSWELTTTGWLDVQLVTLLLQGH